MKRNIILCGTLLMGAGIGLTHAQAESKYNPYTRQWEEVSAEFDHEIEPNYGEVGIGAAKFGAKTEPIYGQI